MLDPQRWEYVRLIDRDGHSIRNDLYHKPEEPASYIIWKEGGTYYAKNGHTGQTPFKGKDALEVIRQALSQGGNTFLKKAEYSLSETLTVPEGSRLILEQGTVLKPTGNFDVIRIKPSSHLYGGKIDVSGLDFSSAAILLDGKDQFGTLHKTSIEHMRLINDVDSGDAIRLYCDEGADYIGWVSFRDIEIEKFENAVALKSEATSGLAWINCNLFDDIKATVCKRVVYVYRSNANYNDVNGNIFHVRYQAGSNNLAGIVCYGERNFFYAELIDVATGDTYWLSPDSVENTLILLARTKRGIDLGYVNRVYNVLDAPPHYGLTFYDDFLGMSLRPEWNISVGSVSIANVENGAVRLTTGAATNNAAAIDWGGNRLLDVTDGIHLRLKWRTNRATNYRFEANLIYDGNNRIYIAFDTALSEGGTAACYDAGSYIGINFSWTHDTDWHIVEIHAYNNDVTFIVDGVVVARITDNIPTTLMSPYLKAVTREDSALTVDVDFVQIETFR